MSYNTWGGKNNRWGNRERKPTGQSNSYQRPSNNYSPTPLFNKICKLIVAGLVVVGVITTVPNIIDMVSSGYFNTNNSNIDRVEVNSTNNNSNTVIKTNNTTSVNNEIIEMIKDKIEDQVGIDISDIEVYKYSEASTTDTFKSTILDNLYMHDSNTAYILNIDNIPDLNSEKLSELEGEIKDLTESYTSNIQELGVQSYLTGNIGTSGLYFVILAFIK